MREYCSNYDRDVEPFVRNLMNDAEKEIKYIEDTMKRQAVKDSFCMIEDMPYLCTEAAYCTNSIVFEANEQQQSNNQNQSQNTQQNDNQQKQNSEKDDSPKPTEVSIKNTSKPGDVQKDKLDQKYGNMSSDELKCAKNAMQIIQTNITCVMTVLEERFTTYMKAMRLIISESNAKDTTSETTDDENNRKADTEKQIADRKASKNTPENNKTK
jgi:hypothetical protein